MKLFVITFLFFCGFNVNASGIDEVAFSQETDSLAYYYKIANNPKTSEEQPKAYKFYINLKQHNLKQGDTLQAVNNLRQIAIMQNNWGDYYSSEASVVEALKLMGSFKIKDSTALEIINGLYNQIGRINHALLKYDASLSYYDKALQIATSRNQIDVIKNNMGLVLRDQGKYLLAETEFLDVYKSSLKFGDTLRMARALNNLAKVRSKLNKPSALNDLLQALELRLKRRDVIGSYSSYKNLSIYYSDRNDNIEALRYANEALRVAKSINQSSYLEDALSLIIGLNKDANVISYKQIKDSLETAKQIQENKNALLKYNVTEEKKKAQESELEKERADKEKLLFQAIAFIIIILAIALYFILRIKYKKENIYQVYAAETRISKKVHDEVANDVYHVMTKLQDTNRTSNENLLDDLDDIYNKTRDISREHSIIDLSNDFKTQIEDLIMSFKSNSTNIITKNLSNINWDKLVKIQKISVYRVLQELLVNMKKHSEASTVMLSFYQKGKKLTINYSDNGVGCELKKQNGLMNTENRIHSINGTFESILKKGFKVKI
jgi:signal transduction histidine kinase